MLNDKIPPLLQYPVEYQSDFLATDGTFFAVRPIQPADEAMLADFHARLSEETVYRRYFSALRLENRVSHKRLASRCVVDYHNEIALVAIHRDSSAIDHLVAVARFIKVKDTTKAEVAFVVADAYQHHGLGTFLLQRMIEIARKEGLSTLEAVVLAENLGMRDLLRRAGFKFLAPAGSEMVANLKL
jgi:acetyltransferase